MHLQNIHHIQAQARCTNVVLFDASILSFQFQAWMNLLERKPTIMHTLKMNFINFYIMKLGQMNVPCVCSRVMSRNVWPLEVSIECLYVQFH